jgi:hypothetical protein
MSFEKSLSFWSYTVIEAPLLALGVRLKIALDTLTDMHICWDIVPCRLLARRAITKMVHESVLLSELLSPSTQSKRIKVKHS